MNDIHKTTIATTIAVISSGAESWVRILCAVIPAALAVAYTIWKWRRDAEKK